MYLFQATPEGSVQGGKYHVHILILNHGGSVGFFS